MHKSLLAMILLVFFSLFPVLPRAEKAVILFSPPVLERLSLDDLYPREHIGLYLI